MVIWSLLPLLAEVTIMDDAEFEEYDDVTSYETHNEPHCDPDEDYEPTMDWDNEGEDDSDLSDD